MKKQTKATSRAFLTFWKRDTMSPAMVLTRAVMSSMKRSGKRFFLGDSKRSVKYRWWIMLFTCGKGRKEKIPCCTICCKYPSKSKLFNRCKNVSHHQLKEKPGLLQGTFSDASAAHHPLEGQLFMEELNQTITIEIHGQNHGGREGKGRGTKIENKSRHCEAPGE